MMRETYLRFSRIALALRPAFTVSTCPNQRSGLSPFFAARFRSVAERYGDVCAAERFAQGAGAPESNDFCKFDVWFWLDRHIERDAPEGFAELFRRLSAYQLLQIRTA